MSCNLGNSSIWFSNSISHFLCDFLANVSLIFYVCPCTFLSISSPPIGRSLNAFWGSPLCPLRLNPPFKVFSPLHLLTISGLVIPTAFCCWNERVNRLFTLPGKNSICLSHSPHARHHNDARKQLICQCGEGGQMGRRGSRHLFVIIPVTRPSVNPECWQMLFEYLALRNMMLLSVVTPLRCSAGPGSPHPRLDNANPSIVGY